VEAGADRSLRDDRVMCGRLVEADVVAIDAPLSLPHPVVCDDPQCPDCFPADGSTPSYGARAEVESAAAWAEVEHSEKGPMPTVMVAGIAFRAIYLSRLLGREGLRVIEVWPMGAYRSIARAVDGPDGAGSNDLRRSLLGARVDGVDAAVPPGGAAERALLDAVAAAYVGWLRLHGRARSVPWDATPGAPAIWIP
jgi:predicted nuclease with RNAse H fold